MTYTPPILARFRSDSLIAFLVVNPDWVASFPTREEARTVYTDLFPDATLLFPDDPGYPSYVSGQYTTPESS